MLARLAGSLAGRPVLIQLRGAIIAYKPKTGKRWVSRQLRTAMEEMSYAAVRARHLLQLVAASTITRKPVPWAW